MAYKYLSGCIIVPSEALMADVLVELLAEFAYQCEVYFPLCDHHSVVFVFHPLQLSK